MQKQSALQCLHFFLNSHEFATSRQSSDAGRSASPMSESGNISDDKPNGKGKAKAKTQKIRQSFLSQVQNPTNMMES